MCYLDYAPWFSQPLAATLAEIGLLIDELPAPAGELAGACPGADDTLLLSSGKKNVRKAGGHV